MTPTAMPIAMAIPRDLRMAVLLPKSCKNFAPNFSEGASKLVETADAARRSRLVERRRQDRSGGSRADVPPCRQPTEDDGSGRINASPDDSGRTPERVLDTRRHCCSFILMSSCSTSATRRSSRCFAASSRANLAASSQEVGLLPRCVVVQTKSWPDGFICLHIDGPEVNGISHIARPSLTISAASNLPSAQVTAGAQNFVITNINFDAWRSAEDVRINSLQCCLD